MSKKTNAFQRLPISEKDAIEIDIEKHYVFMDGKGRIFVIDLNSGITLIDTMGEGAFWL